MTDNEKLEVIRRGEKMLADSKSSDLELLLRLMTAASSYQRVVLNKENYGKTYYVMKGWMIPYEEALSDASKELEEALVAAGIVHVRSEVHRLKREYRWRYWTKMRGWLYGLWRGVACLFGYHRPAGWGREHCKDCGKILDWSDLEAREPKK